MRPHKLKVGNVCVDAMQEIAVLHHKDHNGVWWGMTAENKPWKCANPKFVSANMQSFQNMIRGQSIEAQKEIQSANSGIKILEESRN